jgi:hypothetical protein
VTVAATNQSISSGNRLVDWFVVRCSPMIRVYPVEKAFA